MSYYYYEGEDYKDVFERKQNFYIFIIISKKKY